MPFSKDHMTNCDKIHPSKMNHRAFLNWLKVSQKVEIIALYKLLFPRFFPADVGFQKFLAPDLFYPLPFPLRRPILCTLLFTFASGNLGELRISD